MSDQPTLAETIALLEATLDATHDGILVVDSNRRIVRYNRRFLEMFRLPQEVADLGVSRVVDFVRREVEEPSDFILDRDELWQDLSAIIAGTLRFKDGRLFERYVAPHRVGDRIVGRVISYRDVGESVRAAAALEQHRAFLEKAQEVAHIGSWVADLGEPEHFGWSRETHRIFGVPTGQFDGTAETFFSHVHPDDRGAVRAATLAAERDGAPYDIVHRIIRGDGTIRWVHEQADVIRDATGRAARMVGTVQDVTERRLLEEQLRQSQKMEAIGRLAGGIAHDLNNGLTAIAGYAELALGVLTDEDPARADVQEIRRAAERAGSVTKQLLAFSRRQLLAPRLFSLNDAVSAVARLLSRLLGADVVVRPIIGTSVPPVLGDPGQVEQAAINLALNARDAMPEGGSLTLETDAVDIDEAFARTHVPMPPGRYSVLRVTDTGHGMSRETQNRIFEPFFTTKAIGKGTGLGLSMVYGTMKQIGGFVFVDSEVGRGTTFSLYFPPAPTVTATAPPPAGGDRHGHETLLIVEDEPAVRNLVASSLRKEGYHLLLASSAEEALEIVDTHQGAIDLLVTDAIMPGRSGVDLVRELTARQPALPVILMSGYTEETLPLRDLAKPITLLQKPFTPSDLRRRIRTILDRI